MDVILGFCGRICTQEQDWKTATIDRTGVDKVKLHTGRFGVSPENAVMIDRLEKILKGELQSTDTYKRFYTHEIRELERYRISWHKRR